MVNYLQKKESSTLVTVVKMPIIYGPKYTRAVLLFLVLRGVGS